MGLINNIGVNFQLKITGLWSDIKLLEEAPRPCFSNYIIIWGYRDINLGDFFKEKII